MTRSGSAYRLCWGVLLLAVALCGAAPQQSGGTLRRHPTNGRYFTDNSGRAIYLTGSHSWDTFQQWASTVNADYFGLLQANGHNFMRFWVGDTAWSPWRSGPVEPQPYVRTGPGLAADGGLKFNLNQFNQSYFDQLRSTVVQARDRGIYVSVMLFNSWGISRYGGAENNTWPYHPFRLANNVNNINGDPNGDGMGFEYHSLQIPAIVQRQETYVRKVVDTVNDLDNVLYEICNEEKEASGRDWQYHLTDVIRTYEAGKPKQHPIGITAITEGPNDSQRNDWLFGSSADWVAPQAVLGWDNVSEPYAVDPPVADGGKVSVSDTDHLFYNNFKDNPTLTRQWAWKSFLRGHNPILMEDLSSHSGWVAARTAMGRTRSYADRVDLASMTPQNGLSTTGYCLAKSGSEYIAYQPGSGSFSVWLETGTYAVEWFNTTSGAASTSANVTVSTNWKSFSPPSAEAVLYLKRTASAATYTLSASPTSVSAGQTITVTWTASAGTSAVDWIAIFDVNAPDSTPLDPTWASGWLYTGGSASGSTGFTAPGPGTYNFRYFLDDGWQKVATSNSVTVTGGQTGQDLVGLWKFDEGSGTFAADSSGSGNHGSLVGGAGWTGGKSGSAVGLNGSGSYVNVPSSASLNSPTNGLTIAMWVNKRASVPDYGVLAGRRYGPGWDDTWVLFYDPYASGEPYSFGVRTGNTAFVTGPASTGDHFQWVHVAGVYDGSRVRLYRNGVEVASAPLTGSIPFQSTPLLLGAGDNGNTGIREYVNAAMDDVRLYNRALSASEIQGLAGGSGAVVNLSDLTWTYGVSGWGPIEKNRSNGEDAGGDGVTMRINGVPYSNGIGCHAYSEIRYTLNGGYSSFLADVGVDDEIDSDPWRSSTIVFQVWADGVKLYDSGVMDWTMAAKPVNVSVAGRQQLVLIVTDAGDNIWYDHADWADARLIR